MDFKIYDVNLKISHGGYIYRDFEVCCLPFATQAVHQIDGHCRCVEIQRPSIIYYILTPPAPSSIDVLVVPRLVALHEIEQEGEANMVRERGAAMAALADSDASDGNGEVANS